MSGNDSRLVEERDALSVYFDALLREESQSEEPARPVQAFQEPEPLPPVVAPPVIAPPVEQQVEATEVETAARVESEVETEVELGHPEWGREVFQALLFKAAGLTLAVPLIELSGIQEWHSEQVRAMPGQVDWFLGLMLYRDHNVPVVDTAKLVLPQDRLDKLAGDADERLGRVVFIGDGRWGLGCDAVEEVITLTPEQVSWRSSRTKRRWLAGTVVEHMCAIIDPPVFAEMLARGISDLPAIDEIPNLTNKNEPEA